MGILKVTPEEFKNIKYIPKELSDFWKSYFSTLSLNLSKVFFKYTRANISVRYLHRDVVKAKIYFEAISGNSIIKPFKVAPIGGFGFLFLTDDLANYFVNSILGGGKGDVDTSHLITDTDLRLLENILSDIMIVLHKQMQENDRDIKFEMIDPEKVLFLNDANASEQIISVQQFLVTNGKHSFVFDIAFTNRLLEEFVLI